MSEFIKQILIGDFEQLRKSVEGAQEALSKLKSKIIISDVNGNVITHNIKGFASGIQLREDLRDYILACNVLRENFLGADSSFFEASSDKKKLNIYIYNYVLAVMLMLDEGAPADTPEAIQDLLSEMKLFAEMIIEAGEQDI